MTLARYVLRQLLLGFLFALAGLGLVILPTLTVSAVHKVGGVGLGAILQYMPLVLIELVPYVLPMAFLLACVATFGRLAADNELTAIRMAGVNPLRLLVPGAVLAVGLVVLTDHLVSTVSPRWKYEARNFVRLAGEEELRKMILERNEVNHERFSLWAERTVGNTKENVVFTYEQDDGTTTVTADRATIDLRDDVLVVELENAESVDDTIQIGSARTTIEYPLEPPRERSRDDPKYRTSAELKAELAAGDVDAERAHEIRYKIQSRHALAATYLLFLLLGAPTGVYLRAGSQLAAFTGAMGYAFLYYVLSLRLGRLLAESGNLTPGLAAWATNGLFLVLGVVFVRRGLFR